MRTFVGRVFILPLSIAATLFAALTTLTAANVAQAYSPQIIGGGEG